MFHIIVCDLSRSRCAGLTVAGVYPPAFVEVKQQLPILQALLRMCPQSLETVLDGLLWTSKNIRKPNDLDVGLHDPALVLVLAI